MKSAKVGDLAPEFTVTSADGRDVSLADFKGKQAVVIFFYPRDNSFVCTQEACAFRDAYEDLIRLGAAVIGVSGDSSESHRSFASSQKLPYYLISDEHGELRRLFGVPKSLLVLPGRVTYVIDKSGMIRKVFNSMLFGRRHAAEAMKALSRL